MTKALRPLLSSVLLLGACANLIGITDTEIGAGAGGQAGGGQAGSSGASSGGSSGTNTTGGDAGTPASGGSATSGSGGGAGTGASAGNGAGGSGAEAGASAAGAPAGGADGGCDCPPQTPTCVQGECIVRGPTMVAVNTFFMDSTEVTVGQYAEFLAAKGDDVSGQPAFCSWNTSYAPDPSEVTDELALPMSYVDWCDAAAFCAWADKRLCGAIGGGSLAEADVSDASLSQWYRGCGGPNSDTHPSLDGVNYDDCNDTGGGLLPAGSTCEGSYPGLFDTQGNAAEWVDSCATEDGATDVCLSLGGSYTGVTSDYCDEVPTMWSRSDRYGPLGFRCCSQ